MLGSDAPEHDTTPEERRRRQARQRSLLKAVAKAKRAIADPADVASIAKALGAPPDDITRELEAAIHAAMNKWPARAAEAGVHLASVYAVWEPGQTTIAEINAEIERARLMRVKREIKNERDADAFRRLHAVSAAGGRKGANAVHTPQRRTARELKIAVWRDTATELRARYPTEGGRKIAERIALKYRSSHKFSGSEHTIRKHIDRRIASAARSWGSGADPMPPYGST